MTGEPLTTRRFSTVAVLGPISEEAKSYHQIARFSRHLWNMGH